MCLSQEPIWFHGVLLEPQPRLSLNSNYLGITKRWTNNDRSQDKPKVPHTPEMVRLNLYQAPYMNQRLWNFALHRAREDLSAGHERDGLQA